MTRLYFNTGIWVRTAGYLVVIAGAALWGVFELWRAAFAAGGDASSGAMFGVLFLGGAAYAVWQTVNDWRDLVVQLDRDDAGILTATVWTPLGPKKLAGPFANWRSHVKIVGRGTRVYFIYADHASVARPLRFELRNGIDLAGLREIAPEAAADHEAASGPAMPG